MVLLLLLLLDLDTWTVVVVSDTVKREVQWCNNGLASYQCLPLPGCQQSRMAPFMCVCTCGCERLSVPGQREKDRGRREGWLLVLGSWLAHDSRLTTHPHFTHTHTRPPGPEPILEIGQL